MTSATVNAKPNAALAADVAAARRAGVWRQRATEGMSNIMGQEPSEIQDTIRRVLERNRLAVLATQRNGQPHASLIAFTPLEGLRFLAFASIATRSSIRASEKIHGSRFSLRTEKATTGAPIGISCSRRLAKRSAFQTANDRPTSPHT